MNAFSSTRVRTSAALLSLTIAAFTGAQQTLTILHPTHLFRSQSSSIRDGEQGGYTEASQNGSSHAALWRGTPGSWVDLHPDGLFGGSKCFGVGGGRQVGTVSHIGVTRASLWSGSKESRIDLHPEGALISTATCVDGELQAGFFATTNIPGWEIAALRACVWRGSAESMIDLHPEFAVTSTITASFGGQHVGWAMLQDNSPIRACLWRSNDPATCVLLVPDAGEESVALCAGDGQQGGYESRNNRSYARLWSGSAESMIDLNPSWAGGSKVLGISGGVQVGYLYTTPGGYTTRPCLWIGTAESCVILDIPAESFYSWATGVTRIGNTAYISGWVFDGRGSISDPMRAVLWTFEIPCTSRADFNGDGFLDFFDYASFVDCFEGFDCPPGRTADFNGDGAVDYLDITGFLAAYEEGC